MSDLTRVVLLVALVVCITVMSFIVTSHCYPAPCDPECRERRARQWDYVNRLPAPPER